LSLQFKRKRIKVVYIGMCLTRRAYTAEPPPQIGAIAANMFGLRAASIYEPSPPEFKKLKTY
jgi:hypothetical protein